MDNKFGRSYALSIQTQNPLVNLNVALPLTMEFDITRKLYSSANVSSLRVYNLSMNHRNQVRKNAWQVDEYRQVVLRAGYGLNLPIIFQGNITQAWSVREGDNFITTIEGFDGGYAFANPQTNPVFPSNTPQQAIITTLAGNLPKVAVGAIGAYSGSTGLGASYSEPTSQVLAQLTGNGFFVDNEVANCLNTNEVIAGDVLLISPQSGLLNTPVLEQNFLYFDILFEPKLYIGQQVILQSTTDFLYNGPAKVVSIHHRGTISAAVCGDAVSSVGLDISSSILKQVPRVIAA